MKRSWVWILLLAASAAPASSGCADLEARAWDFQDCFRFAETMANIALGGEGPEAREARAALESAAVQGKYDHTREVANRALERIRKEKR